MILEEERPGDRAEIAALNRAAFGGGYESELITRLHGDGLVVLSLVAREGAVLAGHILFSTLNVECDGRVLRALALAPMAVPPARQRQGIGSALIKDSLERLRARGWDAVFVLGHPDYYPRFGFCAEAARKFASPFAGEAFMALSLKPGALVGQVGSVAYPAAFNL